MFIQKEISSARILYRADGIAIETLQYFKKMILSGSTLMVSNSKNTFYEMFFVSCYTLENEGCMFGYFFQGTQVVASNIVKLCLNNATVWNKVSWVNILGGKKYFDVLKNMKYLAVTVEGYIVVDLCPTNISLPNQSSKYDYRHKIINYIESPLINQNQHKRSC